MNLNKFANLHNKETSMQTHNNSHSKLTYLFPYKEEFSISKISSTQSVGTIL